MLELERRNIQNLSFKIQNCMAQITLEGMEFYAYHGVYPEEQKIGTNYVVDVFIDAQVARAAVSDDLKETINYETIYLICESVMRHPSKLIETVAERIALGIKNNWGFIREMKVRVRKMNPPLGGIVKSASVEVDGNFSKKCGRCSRPMLCYSDKTCWCMDAKLYPATLDHLKGQFNHQCLCKDCVAFFTL